MLQENSTKAAKERTLLFFWYNFANHHFDIHPQKPRASTGTGREGRDWDREKGGGRGGEGKGKGKGEALGSFSTQIISRSITFLSRYWPHF